MKKFSLKYDYNRKIKKIWRFSKTSIHDAVRRQSGRRRQICRDISQS